MTLTSQLAAQASSSASSPNPRKMPAFAKYMSTSRDVSTRRWASSVTSPTRKSTFFG